ncbi:MAG TPA: hypothetical protein VIK33_11710 [Anaerolineae bacterium]
MRLRILLLLALLAALVGYFGPWTWHPAIAFRYSADDLSEFVKFMPAVRSGQVSITRELFFLPIWLATIGLALWFGKYAGRRWVRWMVGALVIYAAVWPMPMYPFILDAYRSPEFGLSFWGSLVAAAVCLVLLAFGSRLPERLAAFAWIVIGIAGATIAPLHFIRLKPALDALHTWTLSVGWGIAAVVIGFAAVALVSAWMIGARTSPHPPTPFSSPARRREGGTGVEDSTRR